MAKKCEFNSFRGWTIFLNVPKMGNAFLSPLPLFCSNSNFISPSHLQFLLKKSTGNTVAAWLKSRLIVELQIFWKVPWWVQASNSSQKHSGFFCERASARIFEDVTKIGMALLGDVGYWYFISHSFLYEVIRLSAI